MSQVHYVQFETVPFQKAQRMYSLPRTAAWFASGGMVTALFSGSLFMLTKNVDFSVVFFVGMVVPCFTWFVQGIASVVVMPQDLCRVYWGELGRICLLGSFALLPAAILNLCLPAPSHWMSAANVLASVCIMGVTLHYRVTRRQISPVWPVSWICTISLNMCLFLLASRNWW